MNLLITRIRLQHGRPHDTQYAHSVIVRIAPSEFHRPLYRLNSADGRDLLIVSGERLNLRQLGANLTDACEESYRPALRGHDIPFALRVPAVTRVRGCTGRPQTEDEIYASLERRGEENGFEIVSAALTPERFNIGKHHTGQGDMFSVDIRGTLNVTDEERYVHALTGGLGRKRPYGFGLLLTGDAIDIAPSLPVPKAPEIAQRRAVRMLRKRRARATAAPT